MLIHQKRDIIGPTTLESYLALSTQTEPVHISPSGRLTPEHIPQTNACIWHRHLRTNVCTEAAFVVVQNTHYPSGQTAASCDEMNLIHKMLSEKSHVERVHPISQVIQSSKAGKLHCEGSFDV